MSPLKEGNLSELAYHSLEAAPGGDLRGAIDYATEAAKRLGQQLAYALGAREEPPAAALDNPPKRPFNQVRCRFRSASRGSPPPHDP